MSEDEYPTGEGSANYSGAKIVRFDSDSPARKIEKDGHKLIGFKVKENPDDPHNSDAIHTVAERYRKQEEEAEKVKKKTVRERIANALRSRGTPTLSDRHYLGQLPNRGVANADQIVAAVNDEANKRTAEAYVDQATARAESSDKRYRGPVAVKRTLSKMPPVDERKISQN